LFTREEILSAAAAPFGLSDQQANAVVRAVEVYIQSQDLQKVLAIVIAAVAGSGKTYTLKALIRALKSLYPEIRIAYLVFGKKNQIQAAAEIPCNQATVTTFHSSGFSAFKLGSSKRFKVEPYKMKNLISESGCPFHLREAVEKLVCFSKSKALGCPNQPSMEDTSALEDLIEHYSIDESILEAQSEDSWETLLSQTIANARDILKKSNEAAYQGEFNFDDQLYMPVVESFCLDAEMDSSKFDVVLIDEAQDTSTIRRELAAKLVRKAGLIVAVGDPQQAIFGFTGADNDALDQITSKFQAETMPLSVSYRCPKAVVDFVKMLLPDSIIESAPNAILGEVKKISLTEMLTGAFNPSDFIICRYNKPLVELCFSLLARGIACQIAGKDIAARLIKLAHKWKSVKTLDQLEAKLEDWLQQQRDRLIKKGDLDAANRVGDMVDCILFLIETMPAGSTLSSLQTKIESMFVDENGDMKPILTLMSCHKSKGLEAPRVFWLGRTKFQPSKFAKKAWQMHQERNLIYVTATRSQHTLVDVSM
jgi:superfamily I DNA/RNA helicase